MRRAIISVSDKTGAADFARGLVSLGFEVVSTGGTRKLLAENGVDTTGVSEVTGFPECLDGRVKTLHPNLFAGILAMRDNAAHTAQIAERGIAPVDIVAVNLYPFKATVLKDGVTLEEAVENIDIGGPSMVRAAAKNYRSVCVITDPADYEAALAELERDGKTSVETNFRLAAKAFAHTAHYDALIAEYLAPKAGLPRFGGELTLTFEKAYDLRYGENPQSRAAFYRDPMRPAGCIADAVQLHGKELSFNNINDANGALELLKEFDAPCVVAGKHTNPCGVGIGADLREAWRKAFSADPTSIFGGIIACNREVDKETALAMREVFLEIIIAPSFSGEAFEILSQKKNLRLLSIERMGEKRPGAVDVKRVGGGLLAQDADDAPIDESGWRVVTRKQPTEAQMADLRFVWRVVKHVKSNGIAIGKNGQTLGVGPGQTSRIWATIQAIDHCHQFLGTEALKGAALASDAFFPFHDCVEAAAGAGVAAIIQPGGSKNDQESIEECDKHGLAMIFTGERHFKH